jgi:hypothetical protein
MADQNRQTDLIKTPEVGPLRYFDENPTEEESIEGDQSERMGEVAVILEIELVVEKAENKIGVREESHAQTGNRSPMADFLISDRLGNHRTR